MESKKAYKNQYLPEEKIQRPEGATLWVVLSFDLEDSYFYAKKLLESDYSPILYESNPMPKWILPPLQRSIYLTGNQSRILSFQRRIHRDELPPIYKQGLKVTKKLVKKDPSLRIYPGYLTRFNTVLASSTDDFHKIYLYHGIYGEIIYKYIGSRLSVQETAPEFFHTRDVMYFFTNLREAHEYHLKKTNTKKLP